MTDLSGGTLDKSTRIHLRRCHPLAPHDVARPTEAVVVVILSVSTQKSVQLGVEVVGDAEGENTSDVTHINPVDDSQLGSVKSV